MKSILKNAKIIHFPVSKPLRRDQDSYDNEPNGFLTVRELSSRYGLSPSSIYDLVKRDPNFPYRNVGLKKKYVIPADAFEHWLAERTKAEKKEQFNIPSAADLIERYAK